jgi:hypothetical protein
LKFRFEAASSELKDASGRPLKEYFGDTLNGTINIPDFSNPHVYPAIS